MGLVDDAKRLPVVIVNGILTPYLAAEAYAVCFRLRGFPTTVVRQKWLGFSDLREAAKRVGRMVERVRQQSGAAKVNLVGMSLGGLCGYYYLKCLGGSELVERFIAIGSPLSGSSLRIALGKALSPAQASPGSDLFDELDRAPPLPATLHRYSVGTPGDLLVPAQSWDQPGFEVVTAPYDLPVLGHWILFIHPDNQRAVVNLLEKRL